MDLTEGNLFQSPLIMFIFTGLQPTKSEILSISCDLTLGLDTYITHAGFG